MKTSNLNDLLSRTPINKLANLVINQSNVSNSFENSIKSQECALRNKLKKLRSKKKRLAKELGLKNATRKALCEIQVTEVNKHLALEFIKVLSEFSRVSEAKEDLSSSCLNFTPELVCIGQCFEVFSKDGSFLYEDEIIKVNPETFKGTRRNSFNRKTGRCLGGNGDKTAKILKNSHNG